LCNKDEGRCKSNQWDLARLNVTARVAQGNPKATEGKDTRCYCRFSVKKSVGNVHPRKWSMIETIALMVTAETSYAFSDSIARNSDQLRITLKRFC
jgi:hypothetical protein